MPDLVLMPLLNALSAGLLLFLLSSGLTLVFSLMGVMNFAHAAFYMLGAYVAWALSGWIGFWPSLVLAPVVVGLLGAAVEHGVLRRVHRLGHVPEMLVTFGLGHVVVEVVQMVWGRTAVPFHLPAELQGSAFTVVRHVSGEVQWVWGSASSRCGSGGDAFAQCLSFPASRALIMAVAIGVWMVIGVVLRTSRVGLVIRAATTQPLMVEALGHRLSRVMTIVFGGGCALAALAGVLSGATFVTEPSMAAVMGPLVFVVIVVGGLGSLSGAFWASLLVGALQTLPLVIQSSVASLLQGMGVELQVPTWLSPLMRLPVSQWAPVLPYALLVGVLALRPQGLWGRPA